MLNLYFTVGKMIHTEIERQNWGAKVLQTLSTRLQQELPGLRGFSAASLRKMRMFYETWQSSTIICSSVTNKLDDTAICSLVTNKFASDTEII